MFVVDTLMWEIMEDQGWLCFPSWCTNSHSRLSYRTSVFGPIEARSVVLKSYITRWSECSPAHPPFCWSGVSNAEKWFVVYFLMRQGDMGIRQLKLIETNTGACLSQPPTTVRISSKKKKKHTSRHAPFPSYLHIWIRAAFEHWKRQHPADLQSLDAHIKGEMLNSSKSALNYFFPAALPPLLTICMPARTAPLRRHYE